MIIPEIVELYQDWQNKTENPYLNIDLKTLRKLSELNKIINESVFDAINNVAYFLHANNHKKPSEQYLDDLKALVDSLEVMNSYFNAQIAFNTEVSSHYESPDSWRDFNQDTINQLNKQDRKEHTGFYSMLKEFYLYGKLKKYENTKITNLQKKIEEFPYFRLYSTSKSDSEIMRFFDLKYQVETNEALLKVGMQDLYRYFDENFSEYEPIDFCNEILIHIFKFREKPMKKIYYTKSPPSTHIKITSNGHKISNIKKKV